MAEVYGKQGGDAWLRSKCGRISGSGMADACSYNKTGVESAKRFGYRMALASERLTGKHEHNTVTPEMQWGSEQEENAVLVYESVMRVMAQPCGFFIHPDLPFAGASPDRLIGEDGLLECKAPKTKTHLEWRKLDTAPPEYMPQIMWELACTGRKWADFVSYDPRIMDERGRFIYRRVERDEALIEKYTAEVLKLEAEINAYIEEQGLTAVAPYPVELLEDVSSDPISATHEEFAYLDRIEMTP